jgi:hypothetical protein
VRRIAIVLVVIAAVTTAAAVAFAAESPKMRLAAMRNAAGSQHSVHYVVVSSAPGHKVRMVSDVGKGEGIQRITVTSHGQTGPADVIVRRRTAYIRGNPFTMRAYFGFTKAQATKYAGKWIAIPHSSPGYAGVSADATFGSFLSFLYPQHHLELYSSGKLVGVRGTARFMGVDLLVLLLAPRHGKPLPAEQYERSPNHPGKSLARFSHWNESFHVTAPAHAVPISKVVGG